MLTNSDNVNDIILFQGTLYIQKGWFNNWKSRHCTLLTSRKLEFYYHTDQINNIKPILTIDLSNVIAIHINGSSLSPSITPQSPLSPQSPQQPNRTTATSFDYSNINHTNANTPPKNDKHTFYLETKSGDKYVFGCDTEDIYDLWMKHLNVYVFGDIIHSGYMIKQGHNFKTWKKRWFTLSAHWRELRYYENQNISHNTYKGKVDLSLVNVLRFGDKLNYGFQYTIELITPKRTYVFVTTYHDIRTEWMTYLSETLKGQNNCDICTVIKCMNMDKKIYYKMNIIYEGYLNLFTGDINAPWKQSYYAIDGKTIRLFYTDTVTKMDEFQSAVIKKEYYETYISKHMDGYYLLFGENIHSITNQQMIENYSNKNKNKNNNETKQYAAAYLSNGKHIDDIHNNIKDEKLLKAVNKMKYKFIIGNDIFGVGDVDELNKWINGLKKAVDVKQRDMEKYDDERRYLCLNHLNVLISGFINEINVNNICDDIVNTKIKKCVYGFVAMRCDDERGFIVTF